MALGTSLVADAVERPVGRGRNAMRQEAVMMSTVQASKLMTHRALTRAPSLWVPGWKLARLRAYQGQQPALPELCCRFAVRQ